MANLNMYHTWTCIVSGPDYGLPLSGSHYLTTWGWKICVLIVFLSSHVAYISLRATRLPPCQGLCTCQLEGCLPRLKLPLLHTSVSRRQGCHHARGYVHVSLKVVFPDSRSHCCIHQSQGAKAATMPGDMYMSAWRLSSQTQGPIVQSVRRWPFLGPNQAWGLPPWDLQDRIYWTHDL